MIKRLCLLAAIAALAACGQGASTSSSGTTETTTSASGSANAWFICDGINPPTALAFMGGPPAQTTTLIEYDEAAHRAAAPVEYTLGESEGAAGSVYTPLLLNGQDVGHIRQINPGMLETPGAAYTAPYTSVKLGEREIACRWMPRTRLIAFTDRRSFVINEDADGDLIYSTYDFVRGGQPIETSDGGRTTTFSVEVRGGEEAVSPGGVVYRFANNGYRYVITAETGHAQIQVFHGDQLVQTEDTIATEFGTAAFGQTP